MLQPVSDRGELRLLAGCAGLLLLVVAIGRVAGAGFAGSQSFEQGILLALRDPADLSRPVGPHWLEISALDITALGSPTVLGLVVLAVGGFLTLQGRWRIALFVTLSSSGAWVLNEVLKAFIQRPRPAVVPHLREVVTMSFPSGHALTSAVVYLTLGALLMRVATTRLAKTYCMTLAMLVTLLVGVSRVYLGVHYPTDVIAGWLIGFSWALFCWILERRLERRWLIKPHTAR